jgi:hypothetical protein
MSEYPTLMSMNENMAGSSRGPLFFPTHTEQPSSALSADSPAPSPVVAWDPSCGPRAIQLDRAAVQAMSQAELEDQTLEMLACLKRRPMSEIAAGAAHTDGTLAIDSMTAVWVLSIVGKAFGRRLVRLSEVDRDSLRSVGGVSKLIKQTTASLPAIGAA